MPTYTSVSKSTCYYCGEPIEPGQKRKQAQEGGKFVSAHPECLKKHILKVSKGRVK